MWRINCIIIALVILACENKNSKTAISMRNKKNTEQKTLAAQPKMQISTLEWQIINKGLVNIAEKNSKIMVDIKYATTDNFLGKDVYGSFDKCYLEKNTAEKLLKAQQYLEEIHPDYRLIVYDCARPRSAQQLMWDSIKCHPAEKTKYLSNPRNGSIHNYGCAVDVSIADEKGNPLDMGCAFDYFGPLAYPSMEWHYLQSGELSQQAYDNRQVLRTIMRKAGFFPIQTEWWHFNACTRDFAKEHYPIIE
jgi:zinc D-Ala-D-Ala dipeptidase